MANTNLVELFTGIADSIRAKDGTTDVITASDFPSRIETLPTGNNIEYSEIYYNCQNQGYGSPGTQDYEFDVTNNKSFTFKFDYYPSNTSSYKASFSMDAYFGYEITEESTYGRWTIKAIDSNAQQQRLGTGKNQIVGQEITLDVSNYTKLLLRFSCGYTTSSTANYGYVHCYDIQKQ